LDRASGAFQDQAGRRAFIQQHTDLLDAPGRAGAVESAAQQRQALAAEQVAQEGRRRGRHR